MLDETLGSFCPIIASMVATVVEMLPSSGWGHTSRDLSIQLSILPFGKKIVEDTEYGTSISFWVDAAGNSAGLEFLLFYGTGQMLNNF